MDQPKEFKLPIYEVANVEDAVELANRLKDEGKYDLFRGQVQDWPPISSLRRIIQTKDDAAEARMLRRINIFLDWIDKVPELRYLKQAEHVHDFFAIIQHYGIPTHYIDFTTDPFVAGFFAADTRNPPTTGRSCIYCLDSEDLMSLWDSIKDLDERKGAQIELIRIDVSNLWRLQAQRGLFLFANYDWNIDYPMDRIVFPYIGYPSYPTRERIYPDDKSPLEQLLDQYFSIENSTLVGEQLAEMVQKLKARGGNATIAQWKQFRRGFYEEAFETPPIALDSWNDEILSGWEEVREENFYQTIGPTLKLNLSPTADPKEIRRSISFAITQILRSDPTIRTKAVSWTFSQCPSCLSLDEFNDAVRPLWNGMRRLPYDNSELAGACGSAAALVALGFRKAEPRGREELFSRWFGDCIEVSFANDDMSVSAGFVTSESLESAIRPDMSSLLTYEFKAFAESPSDLLKVINSPRLMFEFDRFRSSFAREVIPAQSVLGRSPILFNPARLITFGLH